MGLFKSERAFAPHCDQRVLHAPGVCAYCDEYPDWQQARIVWGISFTGGPPATFACPSELARPLENINRWPGNRPAGPTIAGLE